ncbi:MAG: putative TetR family transcriptional regulator [Pseudonocardiales bacterium]|nr:putative TetR family transcriptional regulator [Pseudonocardiales bacterium]
MTLSIRPLRKDAAENRKRLLVAAAQVFAEHGPEAGVEEVARAAGVGMGTLYRRFPTKQALVEELVAELRSGLAAIARSALEQPDERALEHLLMGAGTLLYAHRGCLHQLWQQTESGLEALQEFRDGIGVALARSQRAGTARPDLVPSDISMTLWAMRGVIEMTRTIAPAAWKRHLEVSLIGLRTDGPPLTEPALTVRQVAAISKVGRVSVRP